MKIGFIGTGAMGGALATAAAKTPGAEMLLADFYRPSAEKLAEKIGGTVTDNLSIAKGSDVIFFGVKPNNLEDLAAEIKGTLAERKEGFMVVSMLAGKTTAQLAEALGAEYPIIRILPNIPVMVGEGMIMYHPNEAVSDEQLETFKTIMSNAGRLSPQQEPLFPAGAGVQGCGPAFAAMFIEALADGGVACGLSRAQAIEYAAQMTKGTAEHILQTGVHPDQFKDMVCSPGGTTIQGVRTLEKNGFRSSLFEAVIATYEKDIQI